MQRLLEGVDDLHRRDRAEGLLRHDRHALGAAGQHRRRIGAPGPSGSRPPAESFAPAAGAPRTCSSTTARRRRSAIGPIVVAGLSQHEDPLSRLGDEGVEEGRRELLMHVHPRYRRADLPGIGEGAERHLPGRPDRVDPGVDEAWVLTAALEDGKGTGLRAAEGDRPGGVGGPTNGLLGTATQASP
jgi:hypothetical protein